MFTWFMSSLCFVSGFVFGVVLLAMGQEYKKQETQDLNRVEELGDWA